MKDNFTKNVTKNAKSETTKATPGRSDTRSVSSVTSTTSTSITTHKKTNRVAVTETKSVLIINQGKISNGQTDQASVIPNDQNGIVTSVSQFKSIASKDVEISTLTKLQTVTKTEQYANFAAVSGNDTNISVASEQDMKMILHDGKSKQGTSAAKSISLNQENKSTGTSDSTNDATKGPKPELNRPENLPDNKTAPASNETVNETVVKKVSDTKVNNSIQTGSKSSQEMPHASDIVIKIENPEEVENSIRMHQAAASRITSDLSRDEWLHNVHNWDEKGESENYEMVASVSEIELILTKELVRRFKSNNTDSNSDRPIFYHDHENGHALVFVNKDFYIEPNRKNLLRVIGCGHFLLSYFSDAISHSIEECRQADNLEWAASFLTSVRSDWEKSVLSKAEQCDPAVGIGSHFNDLASKWIELNVEHLSGAELQHWLDLNAVKFMCRTMCFSDASQDLAASNRNAYKEFLFLHMACIVDHDDPKNMDPVLLKQFKLLNRKRLAPELADGANRLIMLPQLGSDGALQRKQVQQAEKNQQDTESNRLRMQNSEENTLSEKTIQQKKDAMAMEIDSSDIANGAGKTTVDEKTALQHPSSAASPANDPLKYSKSANEHQQSADTSDGKKSDLTHVSETTYRGETNSTQEENLIANASKNEQIVKDATESKNINSPEKNNDVTDFSSKNGFVKTEENLGNLKSQEDFVKQITLPATKTLNLEKELKETEESSRIPQPNVPNKEPKVFTTKSTEGNKLSEQLKAREFNDLREVLLQNVHNWDEKGQSENCEMVASVSEIELILTKELVRRFKSCNTDGKPDRPIFYHDHENGHALVFVNKDFYIEPNRKDLLRVIGCGHFLLSYFSDAISHSIEECRQADNLEWAATFLTSVRSDWEKSVLSKTAQCDPAVGIGSHFNDLASKWLGLNVEHLSGAELQHWLDLNAVKFMCRTMCFSDASQDLAASNRNAYKEFLFLHMACIVDHEDPKNIDPLLLKQFNLLNKKLEATSLLRTLKPAPSSSSDLEPHLQNDQLNKLSAVKADSQTECLHKKATLIAATLPSMASQMKDAENQLPKKTIGWGRSASNEQVWQACDDFKSTEWFEAKDGRTMKVAEQHWKLGCKGCPADLQDRQPSKDEKSPRRRKCKWVTIKRTVLAKRSVSKETKTGSESPASHRP